MKRDFELIKKIMIEVEKQTTTAGIHDLQVDGYSLNEVSFNTYLMNESGLIKASFAKFGSGEYELTYLNRLTWKGHEFLDNARNDTVWKKTIGLVKEKGGSVSFSIFQNLLQSQATKLFEGL
tara:strand:- start:12545 stop:12910 length:366 start_codon:yes stop_codon:yes gene_type:complete